MNETKIINIDELPTIYFLESFRQVTIKDRNFSKLQLNSCHLSQVVVQNCNFSNCQLRAGQLQNVTFINCQFIDCALEYSALNGLTFLNCSFKQTVWKSNQTRELSLNFSKLDAATQKLVEEHDETLVALDEVALLA